MRPAFSAWGLVLLLALVAPLPAHAAGDGPRDYAALAPVQTTSNEGLQRIVLPLAVWQASRSAALADLRVFNAEGEAVPLAFSGPPAAAEAPTRSVPVPRFVWPAAGGAAANESTVHVRVDAAGAVLRVEGGVAPKAAAPGAPRVWLLDIGSLARDGERLAALQLDWPAQPAGVSLLAEVEASDDATHWRPWAQAPLLETASSASAPNALARKRIVLPVPVPGASAPKYLRLSLDGVVPLRAVNAELQSAAPAAALDSARVDFQPVAPDTGAPREWRVDLQGALPLRRLQLHLPQANTLASFDLERRGADEPSAWQPVAALTAYRLLRNGRDVEAPPVELPGEAARHWRLRLRPGAPEVGGGTVAAEVFWPPRQLVFAARGSAPFRLAVGRDAAAPVAVPLALLIPGHRAGDEFALPAATLAPLAQQVVVPRSVAEQIAEAGPAERRKWLLWAVLVAAVGGLAWLARRLMRDMKA